MSKRPFGRCGRSPTCTSTPASGTWRRRSSTASQNAPYGERLRGTNHLWAEVADTNLRMVGWHTQMVMGKVQLLKLLRDRSQQLGDAFVLREFMDELYSFGALPMSLIRWEMTGYDDEIKRLW